MIDNTIELTKELIALSSITPDDNGCQALLIKRLEKIGFTCESMPSNGVDNLWARYGTASPLFVFAGHTDVVPTGPEEDWNTPPFKPTLSDGFLYGRGASDMKGGIAAMVTAAETFVQANPNFTGSIAFLITSDEEGPSLHGTRYVMQVLKERGIKIDYCIVGEPSSDTYLGDQIRVGRRGSLHGKAIIHGKQGHVAHPHLAVNPIHLGILALHELAHTEWDKGNNDFPPTTFQITNLHSGTGATNVIPGHLEAVFNFRFSTAITVEELQQRTESILKNSGLGFEIEWKVGAEPFLTNHGKLISYTKQAIKEISGRDVRLSTGGGTSDGRFIAPTGAELVELGVSHATAHHVNECVRAEELPMLSEIYQRILSLIFIR